MKMSMEDAKMMYDEYAQKQKDFQMPKANISIDKQDDETIQVSIDVQYRDRNYQFRSIEEKDANDVYQYLNSQKDVREKYSNGNVATLQSTIDRVNNLAERFTNTNHPLYLYSGFIVRDSQTNTFIGLANLGGGIQIGTSEIAFLNRSECWSHSTNNSYSGVGTVETCTLLQYAMKLKEDGYLINGQPLKAIVATARVDNEGSWKACAKAGMICETIDPVQRYGDKLRYQLRKDI